MSAIIEQVLFLKSYYCPKYRRINKHAFLGQSGDWVHSVIYAYICRMLLHMFALMLVVCYQYITYVNVDIIGLNVLLSDTA